MNNARFAKGLVWINGAVPGGLLLWDAFRGQLGANPVNFAIRSTGLLSLIFLTLSLLITPLRQLTRMDALIVHRRTLGLYSAIYAFAHFGIFFWWDRDRSVSSTLNEIAARQYIWFGMAALLIFVPLTVTSTAGMTRRLGPTRWKALHRLVYVAAIGAAVHYLLVNKVVTAQAIAFAAVLGGLLLYRAIAAHVTLRLACNKLKAAQSTAPAAALRPKFWTGSLRLARVFRETPEVQTFRFVPTEAGPLPFDYRPGQYLNLSLDVEGRKVNRSYTIASSPTRTGFCDITVKREPMGQSSKHLHDVLRPGDAVRVSAPAGKFTFTGDESDSVVLIAGGVGVTPLMSKLRYLTDLAWAGEIHFIFVARTEADLIFRQELTELAGRHPNVRVTITLTRADESWPGERGRLTADLLTRTVPDVTAHEFHICGPDAMAIETRRLLADLGVAGEKVKFESFTPPRGEPTTADDAPAAVAGVDASLTFSRSGQTVDSTDGQSILEMAENVGIALPFDCRVGTCGTCKVKLQSGRVAMDNQDALTAADRASGMILACQAKCLDAVVVDS